MNSIAENGDCSFLLHESVAKTCSWMKPKPGWHKLNSDGAVRLGIWWLSLISEPFWDRISSFFPWTLHYLTDWAVQLSLLGLLYWSRKASRLLLLGKFLYNFNTWQRFFLIVCRIKGLELKHWITDRSNCDYFCSDSTPWLREAGTSLVSKEVDLTHCVSPDWTDSSRTTPVRHNRLFPSSETSS